MKKHYETHVEDTDKLISAAGPVLDYKSWYEQYRKLMEEQAQRKYGLYTPTSEGDDDDFPSIPGMIARYSALGLTNEQMATNPVWVDKTGNGHDLQMKNFAWKEGSGISDVYLGALVFDGVNDYGICDNFPILTKEKGYTVVALRQWLSNKVSSTFIHKGTINSSGAFVFEFIRSNGEEDVSSFGKDNVIDISKSVFSYQTSNSYNGASILSGDNADGAILRVGTGVYANYTNVAIWEIVILDHDATEEELTKIKDYFVKTYPWLFPDQAWTVVGKTNEDEDRATIANITGNGNDLVLSNFGFAKGSGYGLYNAAFSSKSNLQYWSKQKIQFSKSQIETNKVVPYLIMVCNDKLSYNVKIKMTGFDSGVKLKWGFTDGYTYIEGDGIHVLNKKSTTIRYLHIEYSEDFDPDHVVTIEQIPEYEGYLVTDGVDDKAVSKQFKFGENFTVILDFKFPVKKISYCGFDLSSKVRIQNLQGSGVYVVLKGNETLIPSNVVRAVTSEGKVYDENWNEYNIVPGNISSNYTMVNLGFDGSNQFAESATKLAGIYSSALSKDDCIKAYNYLQTLKAK